MSESRGYTCSAAMCGRLLSEEVANMVCVNVYDSTHVYVEEAFKGEAASSARLVVAGAGCLLR